MSIPQVDMPLTGRLNAVKKMHARKMQRKNHGREVGKTEAQETFGVPEQALSAEGSKVFSLPSRVFRSSESLSLVGERLGEGAPNHSL